LFADGDPIGRRIRCDGASFEIVGVVQDARYLDIREMPPPALFAPLSSNGMVMQTIYVRTTVEPSSLAPAILRGLQAESIITSHVQTLEQYTDEAISEDRILAGLSSVLGAVAALLTAVGLYSVIAFWVARRTREIGIRVALGATRRDILRLVIGEGAGVVGAGLVTRPLTTSAVTRLARSLLFGISPTDLTTLSGATVMMLAIAAVAAYLPARRALSTDPVSALRRE